MAGGLGLEKGGASHPAALVPPAGDRGQSVLPFSSVVPGQLAAGAESTSWQGRELPAAAPS